MQPDPATRVTDDDREQVVNVLTEHVGSGRLELRDFEHRAGAAYGALTFADLQALLSDLPDLAPGNRGAVRDSREAGWHLARTSLICIVIWIATSVAAGQLLYFWPAWVIGPWGAAMLLFHVAGRRGACS